MVNHQLIYTVTESSNILLFCYIKKKLIFYWNLFENLYYKNVNIQLTIHTNSLIFISLLIKMKCLKCWTESKYEFCRKCKEEKHIASSLLSQNKKKLIKIFEWNRLTPSWFSKFILYANNILKSWKIYMEHEKLKITNLFDFISTSEAFAL